MMASLRTSLPLVLSVLAGAACQEVTGPTAEEIQSHRKVWEAQHVTSYTYNYLLTGFFINYEGQVLTVQVRADTVRSVVFAASGLAVPGSVAEFPTIDRLFDEAEAAAKSQSLARVEFDSGFGFPTRLDLRGPPDASGSVFASDLRPLP